MNVEPGQPEHSKALVRLELNADQTAVVTPLIHRARQQVGPTGGSRSFAPSIVFGEVDLPWFDASNPDKDMTRAEFRCGVVWLHDHLSMETGGSGNCGSDRIHLHPCRCRCGADDHLLRHSDEYSRSGDDPGISDSSRYKPDWGEYRDPHIEHHNAIHRGGSNVLTGDMELSPHKLRLPMAAQRSYHLGRDRLNLHGGVRGSRGND